MLTKAENELLVRTGPGTPMGELYRRFWAPVMLASELGGPDSAPVRVNVLGERLVAFRDSAGTIGLLSAYCPHRRANLFWGRNEELGLRCVYHGWKFDVSGQCTDMPNCPEGDKLHERVQTRAYPVREAGGLIWAYLGPKEKQPPLPALEMFDVPASHRHITKIVANANYMQLQEGDVDSSHVSFLHSRLDGAPLAGSRVNPNVFVDRMPRWFTTETDYGLLLSAQRTLDEATYQWRVNQWLMPYVTMIAAKPGTAILHQIRVPIDDERAILFRTFCHPERPLTAEELEVFGAGVIVPEMIPGTFTTKENITNDYLIDREAQKGELFTGIKSIVAQDLAVVEDQEGPVLDRSSEYLVSSDRAIIMLRKRLLARAKELMEGIEPPEAQAAKSYRVRPADFTLPRDVPVPEGARELLFVGAPS